LLTTYKHRKPLKEKIELKQFDLIIFAGDIDGQYFEEFIEDLNEIQKPVFMF